MKFEELIMQEIDEKQKTMDLQQEVEQLEEELEEEMKLTRVLKYALDGPLHLSGPRLSTQTQTQTQTHLPFEIKALLTELATMEEEIMWLEKKVHKLNLSLYLEKKHTREWILQQLKNLHPHHKKPPRKQSLRRQQNRLKFMNNHELQDHDTTQKRRSSFGSCTDTKYAKLRVSVSSMKDTKSSGVNNHTKNPNKLSEDLIKCLIGTFLEMNQPFPDSEDGSDIVPKQISCISSKSFISITSFNSASNSNFDPYAVLLDLDGANRDIGPYKTFTQITRNTLNHTRIAECSVEAGKLRVMMQKLCSVNLNLLTYKQKLAFWINIYNACIMHAFLQHGLPSTQEKLLLLMNKAVINVGGVVVNALAIEHFILRHSSNSNHGRVDEREMLLRQAYGLGFPEPNVTFALCRGSWSSPALRVYTAEDIVNELVRPRMEYLEASVGVVSKKKIMVPKLLQWHIKDFADDMESLLEWIYSQLPQSGSLKRLIMECLSGETKSNPAKMIEIQAYVYEFRYLLQT